VSAACWPIRGTAMTVHVILQRILDRRIPAA
jgi:hypothetical protein